MRVKFYLKRSKPPGKEAIANAKKKGITLAKFNPHAPTSIYALANYEGNTLKIYTGESIAPKYWNAETNSARNTPKFTEHPEFNERLNQIRSAINRTYLDYKNKNKNATPAPAILKPLIEETLKRHGQRTTFLDYFEDFVQRSLTGRRIDPKGKKPIKFAVAKGYKTTLNHIKNFDKVSKRKIDTLHPVYFLLKSM